MSGDAADSASDDPGSDDALTDQAVPSVRDPGERLLNKYRPTDGEEETPGPDVPDFTDVDTSALADGTISLFWWLVFVFNVAIFAMALGLMIVGFDGKWSLGGQVFAAGAILFGYGYYRYRTREREADRNR